MDNFMNNDYENNVSVNDINSDTKEINNIVKKIKLMKQKSDSLRFHMDTYNMDSEDRR